MKHVRNKRIYKTLMINYLKAFALSLILGIISITILFTFSGYASSSEDPSYAEKFMKDDYNEIDDEYIIEHYGTMMVVNDDLEILKSAGEDPVQFMKSIIGQDVIEDEEIIENSKINKQYWNMFLYNLNRRIKGYDCSIKYNEDEHFYLITKMPVSVTFIFSIDINTSKEILPEALTIVVFVVLMYSIVLFIGMYLYSKITAGTFVKPLRELFDGVKKLEDGNYKEHIKISGNNEFVNLSESFNNLSDKLEYEKKMRKETEDNRKRLILDISHDLKNPLTGVVGSLEMCMKVYNHDDFNGKDNGEIRLNNNYNNLDQKLQSHDKLNHYLNMAYNNSLRANSLIESLFEYSKLENPDYEMNLKKIDFCEFIRLCILEELDEIEEAGIIGEYDIPDEPIYAYIDEKEFKRAIHNLISNSVKYNKKGTVIKISLSKDKDNIKLIIEDNGIGIDKSLKDSIFTRFKRGTQMNITEMSQDKSIENKKENIHKNEGTGLGLAIVKKIVNMHSGEIYLETDINKGCIFTIILKTND